MPELVKDGDSEDEEYLPPPPHKASEAITIASSRGTSTLDCRFPCSMDGIQTEALYDTGALRSCISKALYDILPSPPPLRPLATRVVSATGGTLQPVGEVDLKVRMGRFLFAQRFIVCSLLIAPMVIGNDMQFRYQMGQGWKDERFAITTGDAVVVAAILSKAEPYLTTTRQTVVPTRTIANVWTKGGTCQLYLTQRLCSAWSLLKKAICPLAFASCWHSTSTCKRQINRFWSPSSTPRMRILSSPSKQFWQLSSRP